MKKKTPKENKINLWDRLTLSVNKGDGKTEFLTRVEDIKKQSYILEMPIRQSGNGHLSKGDEVEVTYNKQDASYVFKASITDLFEGEYRSVELTRKGGIKRVQRRRFVRLDISGDIVFRILSAEGRETDPLGSEYPGSLLNISAGGVLFETEISLEEGTLLVLSFSLKGRDKLENILAVIKRQEPADDSSVLVGAEFITDENMADYDLSALKDFLPQGTGTFDENLQKLVIQFIYKQQIELRKKGLVSE